MKTINLVIAISFGIIIQSFPHLDSFWGAVKALFVGAQIMPLINYLYLSKTED